jgi:Sec7-like guanine-nucleotide exchange factor
MEKFGEKFIADNPNGSDDVQGVMSAECVYLLSYATMMMQTSLHNPNAAKSRMTLEDFAKMLKGINSGGNLNPDFIRKIYEHVERDPFTLNEDDDARIKAEAALANSLKRKQDLF